MDMKNHLPHVDLEKLGKILAYRICSKSTQSYGKICQA